MPAIRAMTTTSPPDSCTQNPWVTPSVGNGSWIGSSQSAWGLAQGLSAAQIQAAILAIYQPLLSVTVKDEWKGGALPQWYTRSGGVVSAQLVGLAISVVSASPLVLRFTCADGASVPVRMAG